MNSGTFVVYGIPLCLIVTIGLHLYYFPIARRFIGISALIGFILPLFLIIFSYFRIDEFLYSHMGNYYNVIGFLEILSCPMEWCLGFAPSNISETTVFYPVHARFNLIMFIAIGSNIFLYSIIGMLLFWFFELPPKSKKRSHTDHH